MSRRLSVSWRVRAAVAALILPAAVRSMSLAKLMHRAAPLRAHVPLDDRALARWVTRILARLPGLWHLSCLNRSVVLYHLLRAAGRPVGLCIGVARVGRPIKAHAWLTLGGVPYLESESALVTSLPVVARFPDDASAA